MWSLGHLSQLLLHKRSRTHAPVFPSCLLFGQLHSVVSHATAKFLQTLPTTYKRHRGTLTILFQSKEKENLKDMQILPATYNVLGRAFNASPSALGAIALSRAIVQALASPLSGIAGHYCNRCGAAPHREADSVSRI